MLETSIEDKEKLEEDFLSFLLGFNYPPASIFRGPSFHIPESTKRRLAFPNLFGKNIALERLDDESFPCYADLAILDLESQEYIALIEFRLKLNEQVEGEMADYFRAILGSLEIKPPVFLIVPQSNSAFRIYQLRETGIWQEIPKKNFPHHATLAAGHAAERSVTREVKQGKALDRLTTTCYVVAGIIALITIASIAGMSALNISQMFLIFLIAILAVAPHAIGFRASASRNKEKIR